MRWAKLMNTDLVCSMALNQQSAQEVMSVSIEVILFDSPFV